MDKKTGEKKTTNEKPLSLFPLKAEDALKKLLQVSPPKKVSARKRRGNSK
ncbi:MAG TPA: hypothetical protein VMF88_12140 [Bacteroidota bacterium]|nr:hypothetical protein [Bacteroidota bacterium]